MFSMLQLLKALPVALLASMAFANPLPGAPSTSSSSASGIEKRIEGNDATVLYCFMDNFMDGFFATYTNGQTRQSVNWTCGNDSNNWRVKESNQDWCTWDSHYKKHTNDAGFWLNIDVHTTGDSHTIGFNPTGNSIDLGTASWTSQDPDYLNGRCRNEFGDDFKLVDPDMGSIELTWNNLDQTLY
ncbi:hypothetical protein SEPCBS119000_004023 [Sporothrix epigloea]|uniref:Uncharacterized protein n=1 Tax=Sporothrix epigloea TaxID=1892477 RepID=A0ABP0DTL1_9PEZI